MKLIPKEISTKLARHALLSQKNSPKYMFVGGVAGMIGSTVLACRATLKLELFLSDAQIDLNVAREMEHKEYSDSDRQHDIAIIYTRSAVGLAKLYGPSILLGSVSIGLLTKSHNILNERNAALAAAYAAVDKAFEQYRGRVVAKYGEEEDREFRYSMESVDVVDEKTGKTTIRRRVADDEPSMYARFFDPHSPSWSKEAEYNLVFLRCQQSYANDMLKTRGHLFLNEVYDSLGIERTKAGQVVGWTVSKDGDNFVDFGLYDSKRQIRDFVNGREGSILLDFNVDGVIYDQIGNNRLGTKGEHLSWQK